MTHILPAEVELTLCHRSSIRSHSSWMQHFQRISVLIRIANLLSFPWACLWNKSEPVFLSIGFVLQPQACMMLPAARCPASHPTDMQPLLPITRHTKRDGHRGAAVEVPQNWQWAITSWAQKYHMKPQGCVAAESTSPPAHTASCSGVSTRAAQPRACYSWCILFGTPCRISRAAMFLLAAFLMEPCAVWALFSNQSRAFAKEAALLPHLNLLLEKYFPQQNVHHRALHEGGAGKLPACHLPMETKALHLVSFHLPFPKISLALHCSVLVSEAFAHGRFGRADKNSHFTFYIISTFRGSLNVVTLIFKSGACLQIAQRCYLKTKPWH